MTTIGKKLIYHYSTESGIQQSVSITRRNTSINGYMPIVREYQGVVSLAYGLKDVFSARMAPQPNPKLEIRGRVRIEDGITNLMLSPIIIVSLCCFAAMML